MIKEKQRLLDSINNTKWKKWGPYLSERQWGTVREDYSENNDAWNYTPHDFARSKAYRWGEEGIGGNSNWHGPIWFPVNFLIIESLQKFHHYYGDDFLVEYPTGSGNYLNINQIANELGKRLINIFKKNKDGKRPVYGFNNKIQSDKYFNDYILFFEYFHAENGQGLGASHQTGWTGLIAKLIQPRV